MNQLSAFAALGVIVSGLLAIFLSSKVFPTNETTGRFSTIDGLRGYLAFFVFLHHSCIWYFYLHTHSWEVPPSNLYTHFGQSSVAVFFMITGFLFFTKLFDAHEHPISWKKLYISRIFRIAPLYYFTIAVLLIIVAILSRGQLNGPLTDIRHEIWRWIQFTVFGAPNINGIEHTALIVAGVTWSIAYEWVFYLLLPLASLAFGLRPSKKALFVGILGLGIGISMHADLKLLGVFLSGLTAAALVRSDQFRAIAKRKISSLICILCVVITVEFFDSAYYLLPTLLLTVSFSIIAGGNDLFGILSNSLSINLGRLSYSIYLMHGLLLFITFNFVLSPIDLLSYSSGQYWLLITAMAPVLIFISTLTFHFIEQPGLKFGVKLANKSK